ncbi:MAG: A/G-specific adenine glycosylase [Bacteroides sp.]|jgi:A/G-specific adenine glycosylase|nr:A/G-specific adenine glycosylase [Bacteroides sp.]
MSFSTRLLEWYAEKGRSLPWRETHDPYVVWVTEIILQQTRIDQGIDYYFRFLEAFPDVSRLAAAPEDEVLRLWQGLGYYSRARNLHRAAREIVEKGGGQLPGSYAEWLKVPGVGPYTAAAIASIAFGEAVPALDGNVYRVLARVFGIAESTEKGAGKKVFREVASGLIDREDPGAFNQAMMDFGAMVCKPAAPLCPDCIFNRECLALQQDAVDQYPVKKAPKAIRNRYFNYFFFFFEDQEGQQQFLVRQRDGKDIWKNLYELPLIETAEEAGPEKVFEMPQWKNWFPDKKELTWTGQPLSFRHVLTHQVIHAKFYAVRLPPEKALTLAEEFFLVDEKAFERLPKSRLTLLFLQRNMKK